VVRFFVPCSSCVHRRTELAPAWQINHFAVRQYRLFVGNVSVQLSSGTLCRLVRYMLKMSLALLSGSWWRSSSETPVSIYQTVRRTIPEGSHLHGYCAADACSAGQQVRILTWPEDSLLFFTSPPLDSKPTFKIHFNITLSYTFSSLIFVRVKFSDWIGSHFHGSPGCYMSRPSYLPWCNHSAN
jgi:hypothetical protein